jgi:poly(ribitol-phosphate) beta-N-acetylglucosaminyltransferase
VHGPAEKVSAVKVTVVVPVYNPGPYLEDCIASLLRQSLPADEFEAIFVDDGSTDDSPSRLDDLAKEHPHMRVIHQENSGWSGKPRNVGLADARGEYVFFADNDDFLGDEALERMYAFAREHDSDIVIGKMAGKGRGVPRELFRKSYARATLADAPLIDSLTPHKLFRASFLREKDLRFPEGKRRLEDHVFVTAAFFAAEKISVLSSYVCYYHVRRDDASNAGFQRLEPKKYFANLAEALDIVEANTEPGALRDRLYRRWYRVEMVERLRGRRLLQTPDDERQELFDEIRRLSGERFGPGVGAGLPPMQRIVGGLVDADRYDDLVRLAGWEEEIEACARIDDLGWHAGALGIAVTAELRAGAEPVTYEARDGRTLLELPCLRPEAYAAIPMDALDSTTRLPQSRVDVLLRSRATAAEYFLPITVSRSRRPAGGPEPAGGKEGAADGVGDGRFRHLLHGEARVDVSTAAGSAPLGDGVWDVLVRVTSCGWSKDTRLGAIRSVSVDDHCVPAVLGKPARVVTPYWTDQGNLSLDVGQHTSQLGRTVVVGNGTGGRGLRTALEVDATALSFALPLRAVVSEQLADAALRLTHEGSGAAVCVAAELVPAVTEDMGHSLLCAEVDRRRLSPGRWSVEVQLVGDAQGRFTALPATVTVPADGKAPVLDALARPGGRGAKEPPEETRNRRSGAAARFGRRIARRVRRTIRSRR